jgi:hypothetical protein
VQNVKQQKIHNEFHSLIEWNLINIHLDSLAHWIGTNVLPQIFLFCHPAISIHPVPNFSLIQPNWRLSHVHPFLSVTVSTLIPDLFCFGLFFLNVANLGSIWPKRVHIFTQPLNPKKGSWSIPILAPFVDTQLWSQFLTLFFNNWLYW